MGENHTESVSVTVETDAGSQWTVDPGIFGRFAEHLGSGIYPGVYEDYVENGSFDVWNQSGSSPGVFFTDVGIYDGVAYPWEPVGDHPAVSFEQPSGGVRGRRDDEALRGGIELPPGHELNPADVTEPRYQRIEIPAGRGGSTGNNAATGAIRQRIVLPDHRETSFTVELSVKGDPSTCFVRLDAPAGDGEPLARGTVPVDVNWGRRSVTLTVDPVSPERYGDTPYGEYFLTIGSSERGVLDLDWVTAIPDDAVEGKFNPATIEHLRKYNVTTLRWPGGNFASQYRWRDGIGPVEDRPVVPIVNWGGLEPNYLGTAEWLRFCELVDAEPYITVPVWSATGPEEAAEWVEYCNGSTDTEMGALRAEHGHPEPWDVTWWGIGNEVWGSWQVGRTDAADYADRYVDYDDAMRAVDQGIEIDACGIDPWFSLVHDGSREVDAVSAGGGEPPVWNERLFDGAAEHIDGLDVHRYTEGISSHTSQPSARQDWLAAHDETPTGYVETLVNDPAAWDDLFEELRTTAAEHGVSDLRITVGEWGLRAREVEDGWPRADRDTMAHAVFAARILQSMVRNGEDVRLAHWTDFSQFVFPSPDGTGPDHPGAEIFRLFSEPIAGSESDWNVVGTTVSGSPTRPRPATGVSIPEGDDIPLVDAVTVGTVEPPRDVQTLLVNGSLTDSIDVSVAYGDNGTAVNVTLLLAEDGDPFGRPDGWDDRAYLIETVDGVAPIDLALPPASVAVLRTHSGGERSR